MALLRLNRPSVRNALDRALVERLAEALDRLESGDQIRAVVLAGAAPGFCSGSDLRELAALSDDDVVVHEARTGEVVRRLQLSRLPVVAAVEGFAIGGGFLLASSCDVVVSAHDARWHLPEVGLGWVPPWGLQSLVARVGSQVARRLAWGDRSLPAAKLYTLGVVDEVAQSGQALTHATTIARRLAALPAHAVTSTKRVLGGASAAQARELDEAATLRFAADSRSSVARASLAGYRSTRPPTPADGGPRGKDL